MPEWLGKGTRIHIEIGVYYQSKHPKDYVSSNYVSIQKVVLQANGEQIPRIPGITLLRPDIINLGQNADGKPSAPHYEIKPLKSAIQAQLQGTRDRILLNIFGVNAIPGPSSDLGVNGVLQVGDDAVAFFSPIDGVITYQIFEKTKVPEDELSYNAMLEEAKQEYSQEYQTAYQQSVEKFMSAPEYSLPNESKTDSSTDPTGSGIGALFSNFLNAVLSLL